MIAIVVDHCAECPFASGDETPWLCDAHGASDGQSDPRPLPPQQPTPGVWADPPDWCPLRESDRLVTIRRPR